MGSRSEKDERMKSVQGKAACFLAFAVACLVIAAPCARATGECEVRIAVKDEGGKPMPGVEIVLTPLDTQEKPLPVAPWTGKTNKKGEVVFPFLAYNGQGGGRHDVA